MAKLKITLKKVVDVFKDAHQESYVLALRLGLLGLMG